MAAQLHYLSQSRLIDANGIADGASIYFYTTGTTDLAPIFSDAAMSAPMANPVVVGSGAAIPDIYLDESITYRRRIAYTDGTVDDLDPYTLPSFLSEAEAIRVAEVAAHAPIPVGRYYLAGDGNDWAPAFTRAFAAALPLKSSISCVPGASYRFLTAAEAIPDANGWTPPVVGNGATIIIGDIVPLIAHEAAGFRFRGLKSGAPANPVCPKITDLFFDAQSIAFSNGVRSITMENASGWYFDRVHGRNYTQGYHIINQRYADGGAVGEDKGIFVNSVVRGAVLASTSEPNWYPYSDTGDLATAAPGDSIAAGTAEMISIPQSGSTGTDSPRGGLGQVWENATGSPIIVPATITEANLTSAGLTKIASPMIGATVVSANEYIYYNSGGQNVAFCPIDGAPALVQDCFFYGGRYGVYTQASSGAEFIRVTTEQATRGIVGEWTATGIVIEDCYVRETLSSGILLGFGCTDWTMNRNTVEVMASRWIGEALFNIQLTCGSGFGRGNRTNTRNNVTNGQYHLNIGVNCSDIDFEIFARGDCLKAYVAIQSAYVQGVGSPPAEAYAGGYAGAASVDMANIKIRGSITPVTTKAASTGATQVALIQENDATNGEIGLSYVDLVDLDLGAVKACAKYIALYEGATAAKQINNCKLRDVTMPIETVTATTAARFILPRRWAHFREVKNVTNLDDNIERAVPNVATPDLTFGKYWWDTSATAMTGILGGQGATNTEGYEGREIIVRGNSSRAWTTVSGVSGTRDGLRLTGSPITPTNVQRLRLTFSRALFNWIGGLT